MGGYVVLANAHAGSVEREALDAAVGVLAVAGPTEVRMSSNSAALDAALTGLDGRVLVVAGGDGSLHLVANRLRRLGRLDQVGVGLVPLGTGNDFARAAGIPLDAHAAAIALTTARPHRFDLLEDDTGRVVVNAAHAGLGRRRRPSRPTINRGWGRWPIRWGRCLPGSGRRAGRCGSAWTGPPSPAGSGC
jgi:diacylglycerol kinase family enzyme